MAENIIDNDLVQEIIEREELNEIDIKLETEYKNKRTKISDIIYIILFSFFGAFSVGLPFFVTSIKFHWICIVSAVMLLGLIATFILFFKKKYKIVKLFIVCFIFVVAVEIVYLILEKTGFLAVIKDKEKFTEFIKSADGWMIPLFIVLQFLQVVILPIPSNVSTVVGGALFGPLLGSVYSLIGIIPASLLAFLVGRYAGFELVLWLVGKDSFVSALKLVKGKDIAVLTLMFFLPMFPDDVLCFVAGLSSMNILYFSIMIIISRGIQVFTTSYFVTGGLIPFNTWWGLLIWGLILVGIAFLFYISVKKGDKIEEFLVTKFMKNKEKERVDFTEKILMQIEQKEEKKRIKLIKKLREKNIELYLEQEKVLS